MKTVLLLAGLSCNILLCTYPFHELNKQPAPTVSEEKVSKAKPEIRSERKPLAYSEFLKRKAISSAER